MTTDAFLAEVVSYTDATKIAVVLPLIVENDGTDHPKIEVKAIAGVKPAAGDIALIVTIRNDLEDSPATRYFGSSEANGRLVLVVTPSNGVFELKGDYKFTGDISIVGDLTIEGDLTVEGLGTFTVGGQDIEIKTNTVNGLPDVIQKSTGRSAFADGFMTAFGPTVSRIPGGNP